MYEARITAADTGTTDTAASVAALRFMTQALRDLGQIVTKDFAPDAASMAGSSHSLAAGYAAASPIARRRFEAILREAETMGTTGLTLMAGRSGRPDAGTIAAARFLGNSLSSAIRKLETLVLPRAA